MIADAMLQKELYNHLQTEDPEDNIDAISYIEYLENKRINDQVNSTFD